METSSFHTDVKVKIEIQKENEPDTETGKSVEEMEQQFILPHDPLANFNYEEERESNNQNPEFDTSYHGDNDIKYNNNEDNDDFDEYDDPLAQLDSKEKDEQKRSKNKSRYIFTCREPSCSSQFKTWFERDDHWEEEHKISYVCPKMGCFIELFSRRDFDNHIRAHKLPPPTTWKLFCNFCCPTRPFPSETCLQEHHQLKHAHSCPINSPDCPPSFQTRCHRDFHVLEKHNSPDNCKKYPTLSAASSFLQCNHGNCSINFKTRSELFTHVKEEKHKNHKCRCPGTKCNFSTTSLTTLLSHFRTYSDHDPCHPDFKPEVNPWACPICHDSEECQSSESLKKHAVAEHNFSGFPCPFVYPENPETENNDSEKNPMKCGMIFDAFYQLNKHWKLYSEHFPQGSKSYVDWLKLAVPIKCLQEDCQEEFMSQSEVMSHLKSHFPSKKQIPKYIIGSRIPKPLPKAPKNKDKNNDTRKEQIVEKKQNEVGNDDDIAETESTSGSVKRRRETTRKLDYFDIVKPSHAQNKKTEEGAEQVDQQQQQQGQKRKRKRRRIKRIKNINNIVETINSVVDTWKRGAGSPRKKGVNQDKVEAEAEQNHMEIEMIVKEEEREMMQSSERLFTL